MKIFLVLNAMAIVFLLYVLANFWMEANRTKQGPAYRSRGQSVYESRPSIYMVTQRLDSQPQLPGDRSVLRFPVPQEIAIEKQAGQQPIQNAPSTTARKSRAS
jgi:hypothetical protein